MNEENNVQIITTEDGLKRDPRLVFKGGVWSSLIPFGIFLVGTIIFAATGNGTETSYWIVAMIAIFVGMILAKKPDEYFDAVVDGMTERMTIIAIACWVWAGAFAGMLKVSGLVEGLMWLGVKTGLTGGAFVAFTFIVGAIYGTSVGSGWATITSLALFMYPAGVALGANPVVLGGAIIAAGCFGDNLAPVSDTTILSATLMERDVAGVVKTRLPYTFVAAAISLVLFIIFGNGGGVLSEEASAEILATANPKGLLMVIPAAIVVFLALKGKNLIFSITIGMLMVFAIGIPTHLFEMSAMFNISEGGGVGGAFVDGIGGFTSLILLVILITGVSYTMQAGGALNILMEKLKSSVIKTVRGAEVTNWCIMAASAFALSNNVVAMIVAGPLIKAIGDKFHINRYRMANFMDGVHCMFAYTVPWAGGTLLFCRMTAMAAETYSFCPVMTSPLTCVPYSFHVYILPLVFLLSAITGIGRKFEDKEEAQRESAAA